MPVDASLLMRVNVILSNLTMELFQNVYLQQPFFQVYHGRLLLRKIYSYVPFIHLWTSRALRCHLCAAKCYIHAVKKATCSAQLQTHRCNIHLYYSVILTRAVRWNLVQLNCQVPCCLWRPDWRE